MCVFDAVHVVMTSVFVDTSPKGMRGGQLRADGLQDGYRRVFIPSDVAEQRQWAWHNIFEMKRTAPYPTETQIL